MRQFQGGDLFGFMAAQRLDSMEQTLAAIEETVAELLREDEDDDASQPPARVAGAGRLFVLAGGLAALFGVVPTLPPQNPVRQVVSYTVSALVEQMPSEIPDLPDLGPVVIGHPDNRHQPLRRTDYLQPLTQIAAVQPAPSAMPVITPAPTTTTPGMDPSSPAASAPMPAATPTPTPTPQPAAVTPPVLPPGGVSLPPAVVSVPDPVPAATATPDPTATPAATPDPTPTPTVTPSPTPATTPNPSPVPTP